MSCLSLLWLFILVFWGCGKAQRKAKQCAEGSGSTVRTVSTAACPDDQIPQWFSVWTVEKWVQKLSWATCSRESFTNTAHSIKTQWLDEIGSQCSYWTFWLFLIFLTLCQCTFWIILIYYISLFFHGRPSFASIYGCWGHWPWFGAAKDTAARSVAIASIKTSRSGTSAASSATFTVPSLLQWPLGCTSEMLGGCLESLLLNES